MNRQSSTPKREAAHGSLMSMQPSPGVYQRHSSNRRDRAAAV